MKIEQQDKEFKPVTITLETQESVDALHEILNNALQHRRGGIGMIVLRNLLKKYITE